MPQSNRKPLSGTQRTIMGQFEGLDLLVPTDPSQTTEKFREELNGLVLDQVIKAVDSRYDVRRKSRCIVYQRTPLGIALTQDHRTA